MKLFLNKSERLVRNSLAVMFFHIYLPTIRNSVSIEVLFLK